MPAKNETPPNETLINTERLISSEIPQISAEIATEKRPGKTENEDQIYKGENFIVMCDGMGGSNEANVASEAAASELLELMGDLKSQIESGNDEFEIEKIQIEMENMFQQAHKSIFEQADQRGIGPITKEYKDPEAEGGKRRVEGIMPGTTATVAMVVKTPEGENMLITASAGDSPVLLYRPEENSIRQVNVPDVAPLHRKFATEEERRSAWEEIQQADNPEELDEDLREVWEKANMINNSMGSNINKKEAKVPVSFSAVVIKPGDRIIVGSDGIEGLSRRELQQVLEESPTDKRATNEILSRVMYRNKRQSGHPRRHPDDTSVSVLSIEGEEEARIEKRREEVSKPSKKYMDLIKAIEALGEIEGSELDGDKVYPAGFPMKQIGNKWIRIYPQEEVQKLVMEVLRGNKKLDVLTRKRGLRKKVDEYIEERDRDRDTARRLASEAGWVHSSGGEIYSPRQIQRRIMEVLRDDAQMVRIPRMANLRSKVAHYRSSKENVQERVESIRQPRLTKKEKELLRRIGDLGVVEGTKKNYQPNELVMRAKQILAGDVEIHGITRSGGVRKMVQEFLVEKDTDESYARQLAIRMNGVRGSDGGVWKASEIEEAVLEVIRNGGRVDGLTRTNNIRKDVIEYMDAKQNRLVAAKRKAKEAVRSILG